MPPALKAAQFGSAALSPRYYDYTEEFESKQQPHLPALETVAPIPKRGPSAERALVLREGSAEKLETAFETEVNAVLDEESQQDDSEAETEPHLLSDIESGTDTNYHEQDYGKAHSALRSACDNEKSPLGLFTITPSRRRLTQGSDLDLLPSQIGRTSVDTFRPSLDIESKDIPLFNYPTFRHSTYQHNTPSPARQVEVHDKTPTIKSDQGVILRHDDAPIGDEQEDANEPYTTVSGKPTVVVQTVQSPIKFCTIPEAARVSNVSPGLKVGRRQYAITEPVQANGPQGGTKPSTQASLRRTDRREFPKYFDSLEDVARPLAAPQIAESATLKSSRRPESDKRFRLVIASQHDSGRFGTSYKHDSKRNRNSRGLEIRTKDMPQHNESTSQFTPPCSETPLISPKPISPVRELKVKNSIPQLMKALPPLPGQPGYVSPSPPTTLEDEDDFVEILKPYTSLDEATAPRKPTKKGNLRRRPLPNLQKKLPKIRIKSKGPDVGSSPGNRDSRPWNSDSNYPWYNDEPDIELANARATDNNNASFKQKVKFRRSQIAGSASPSGTVRRHPEARRTEPIIELGSEEPKDLFSIRSDRLGAVFRQAGRKLSQSSNAIVQNHTLSSSRTRTGSPLAKKSPALLMEAHGETHACNQELHKGSAKQRRGLKKRFSNLKWSSARDLQFKTKGGSIRESECSDGRKQVGLDSTFGLDNIDFESKQYVRGETRTVGSEQRSRFRRRMKAKISQWMRGARSTIKHY